MSATSTTRIEERLQELELELLRPVVRQSTEWLSSLLANEFREFGASGRIFSKNEIIEALRAGGGIFYSQTDAVQMFGDPAGNWPFGNSQIIGPLNQYFADTTMEKPFQGSPTLTLPPNPYGQGGYAIDPPMKTPYASEWNASVQRQLGSGMLAEVSYVGSNAVKLLNRILDNNATSPGPGSVQLRRQWPLYGAIRWDDNSAPANYNGLTLKLQKRFSHGLTFLTDYTWSHALDVFSSDRGGVSNGTQDPNNWRNDYATSNGSIKQAFQFSDVWELPFGHNKERVNCGPAAQILVGWEWSNIVSFYGGPTDQRSSGL